MPVQQLVEKFAVGLTKENVIKDSPANLTTDVAFWIVAKLGMVLIFAL